MIAAAEIHRKAREWKVDPMIVELDYVLGCFLSRWFRHPAAAEMVFKGGTCLRKCYFPDYRFSEDIDITSLAPVEAEGLAAAIEAVAWQVEQSIGLDFSAQPPRIESVESGQGSPYFEVRVYFRGPLRRTGWPQGIRIDISSGEQMAFPAVKRQLDHPYSDRQLIAGSDLHLVCYDLREILLEKLRALAGQRRYAIARDIYDVHRLIQRGEIDIAEVVPHAPSKFAAKGIDLSPRTLDDLIARKDEYGNDWSRNVSGLVPSPEIADFPQAWQTTTETMHALVGDREGPTQR